LKCHQCSDVNIQSYITHSPNKVVPGAGERVGLPFGTEEEGITDCRVRVRVVPVLSEIKKFINSSINYNKV